MFTLCELTHGSNVLLAMLATASEGQAKLSPSQQFLSSPFLLIGGVMALFYFIVLIPERRRKAEEQAKLAAIAKNDRIVTVGGLHGTVVSTGDEDTVVIKIDESGNTRVKIDRRAIARILGEPSKTKTAQ